MAQRLVCQLLQVKQVLQVQQVKVVLPLGARSYVLLLKVNMVVPVVAARIVWYQVLVLVNWVMPLMVRSLLSRVLWVVLELAAQLVVPVVATLGKEHELGPEDHTNKP